MQVFSELSPWREARKGISGSIGLVPTMGALHAGHGSLIERASAENDHVVAWIFVNSRQFNRPDDFEKYPRLLEQDIAQLEALGVPFLLAPQAAEIYPPDFQSTVEVSPLGQVLEGRHRPGHFAGVCTVLARAFGLVLPQRVYFGEKDAQQLAVVKRMVADLSYPLEVVSCPTIRERSGLAMSSRNALLSARGLRKAEKIFAALRHAEKAFYQGETSAKALKELILKFLGAVPDLLTEYAAIVDSETFAEIETITKSARVLVAASLENVRLIDNLLLTTIPPMLLIDA